MAFDDELNKMEDRIAVAQDEIVMAVMFHETWKPTAYDEDLHNRMGNSFATHSFHIVRASLRREMLLALMRLWDNDSRAIPMTAIAKKLNDSEFFDALVTKRAADSDPAFNGLVEIMRRDMEQQRNDVVTLVQKYAKGGNRSSFFNKLKEQRDQFLAHRQVIPTSCTGYDTIDQEIESFYNDNLKLVRLLISLVLATAFDLAGAEEQYRQYANFFWANARGERTEGHPNYRPPIHGQ